MTIHRSLDRPPRPAGEGSGLVSPETRRLAGLPLDGPLDYAQEREALGLRKLELQGHSADIERRREDHRLRFFANSRNYEKDGYEWARLSREYDAEKAPILAEMRQIDDRMRAIKSHAKRDRKVAQEKLFNPNGSVNQGRALLDLLRGMKAIRERLDRIEALLEGGEDDDDHA